MPVRRDLCDLPLHAPSLVDEATGAVIARLGRYLASGSSAAVFAGERADGVPVAVKILLPRARRELIRQGLSPDRLFERERQTHEAVAARGGSPSLCPVLGHGTVRIEVSGGVLSLPFLLTLLVPEEPHGATLEERVLRHGRGLPLPRARRLLSGIFAGTLALHRAGVVHRDLSPGNILVRGEPGEEEALVADGGIARVPGGETLGLSARTSSYGSPEQCLVTTPGANPLVGFHSDVHALASLAFYVFAGRSWAEVCDGFERGVRGPLPRGSLDPSVAPFAAGLDTVLARGASPLLELTEPVDLLMRLPQVRGAERRFATAEALWEALVGVFPGG